MTEKIVLEIPCGFKIIKRQKAVDSITACELLASKKQKRYQKAEKQGDKIVLYWQTLKCPNCGYESSPSQHTSIAKRTSYNRISGWTGVQLSFFDFQEKAMFLGYDFDNMSKAVCPNCGCISSLTDNSEKVVIENNDNEIKISRVVPKEKLLIDSIDLDEEYIFENGIVFERIVFDFKSGETRYTYSGKYRFTNTDSKEKDYLNEKKDFKLGILEKLILNNVVLKRKIKKLFQDRWSSDLPYSEKELNLEVFALMTKFINFNRNFYEALPYDLELKGFEKSFDYITKKLRDENSVVDLLKESALPNCKTVKRLFFQKPELLLYINECELLYEIINDINLFCNVFNSDRIIQTLVNLHIYPVTKDFYKDYSEVVGKHRLCKQISSMPQSLNVLSHSYCMFSEYEKEKEQKRWKKEQKIIKNGRVYEFEDARNIFSTPMHPVIDDIKDCEINGFQFRWLRKKLDYKCAGRELSNCLKNWRENDPPVVAVYHNNNVVAAVEIYNGKIGQAFQARNERISDNSPLEKAFNKWKEKYKLDFCDDDLPY